MNVRTYVTVGGRPGVYFFSLDAASRLAVWTARTFFHLPYYAASMGVVQTHSAITFQRHRRLAGDRAPWPLQPASAVVRVNTIASATGLQLPAGPPLLHFAKRQDVVAWLPELL